MSEYNYKAVNRDMGRAIHDYGMINPDDRILVAVSGGKDSLTLLWMLSERLLRIPISYELYAVYVDPGFEGGFGPHLAEWCRRAGIELRVEETDHGIFAHSSQNRENPCFMCARMRRKRIFEVAGQIGCSKIALGHHKDDIIETLFINMCYTGVMSTMRPAQDMFGGRFTMIRPLAYVDEDRIRRFAADMGFPEFKNPCPSADNSKRGEIKSIVNTMTRGKKKIKNNIFRSLSHVNMEYMLKQEVRAKGPQHPVKG
ncbi:MAG: tRNA lysidine(34) synthetase [Desulfosalsimonas sp.]